MTTNGNSRNCLAALKKLMERGWNQSELAHRTAPLLPHSRVGRDNISKWIRGKVLPLPHHLAALCKVLECEPPDLLPPAPPRNGKDEAPLAFPTRIVVTERLGYTSTAPIHQKSLLRSWRY